VLGYRRSSAQSPVFDLSLDPTTGDLLTTPLVPGLEIFGTLLGR
jgi:hypothetical protein